MEIKAKAKFIRMSPRKVRLVVDVIRGANVENALAKLEFLNKAAILPVKKLLLSAIANAHHNFGIDKDNLRIKTITVDEGPKLKRYMPKAHGRATPIRKRMSHINLILEDASEAKSPRVLGKKADESKVIEHAPRINKKDMSEQNQEAGKVQKAEGVKPEIFDVRMKGKRRNKQHQDVKKREDKKMLRKIFSRKSGM